MAADSNHQTTANFDRIGLSLEIAGSDPKATFASYFQMAGKLKKAVIQNVMAHLIALKQRLEK